MGKNNGLPNMASVEARRSRYAKGTRVELVSMSDPYTTLKPGDRGMVSFVDDTGTVFADWDNGSTLGAVYGEDEIRLLSKAEVIKEQCRKVASTGKSNMFDVNAVFKIALEMGYGELADFMMKNTKAYGALILTGELGDSDIIEL
ncbi:hypothetical protein SDC9_07318 [bioreactor metagenome]|uniref:DUF4314 domain-containing protein n=1 Tax=bioreactor metagenome TaxID=1076179 RepID=A0A644T751_9ZZZZ|nr:DUF4314 domain-containing protein [Dehalococcoides sp.]WRX71524.1 hypothetical protein [Dehalococcoides mccartyi]